MGTTLMKRELVKWAYGVTTVPSRRAELLPRTLVSLAAGGFDKPKLFVDGDKDIASWEREFGLEVVVRPQRLRTFGNWVFSLAELYLLNPTADRYAIFQDDFVTYRNLRHYLNRCDYPEQGYWNLYTFPENQVLAPNDRTGWYPSNQYGRGAVALVFSREAVVTLLSQRRFIERPQDERRGWRSVDGGIVTALGKVGWKEYVHTPTLVQHTGVYSSMGSKPHPLAKTFHGEEFDALTLLEGSKK